VNLKFGSVALPDIEMGDTISCHLEAGIIDDPYDGVAVTYRMNRPFSDDGISEEVFMYLPMISPHIPEYHD
jgi:hypothetical protein